jgi:hypothetical protein
MKYYLINLGASISQLIHALFGGHSQVAVSGKVGYKVSQSDLHYWKLIEKVIDFTFYPIDGKGHCVMSYNKDPSENYQKGISSGFWFGVMCAIIVPICIVLSSAFWTIYLSVKGFNFIVKSFKK